MLSLLLFLLVTLSIVVSARPTRIHLLALWKLIVDHHYPAKRSISPPKFSKAIALGAFKDGGGCKNSQDITSDLLFLADQGYDMVRLYDIACDQVSNALSAIKQESKLSQMKLLLGILTLGEKLSENVGLLAAQVAGRWESVYAVNFGNELVETGKMTADQVIRDINTGKSLLSGQGWNGPSIIIDTWVAIANSPSLCTAGDFIGANAHPYFDLHTEAATAASFLTQTVIPRLKSACSTSSSTILITETGWPSSGGDKASSSLQATAIAALESLPVPHVLFEAFNEPSKATNSGQPVEGFWGIYTH
ncbi:Cell surface mannoprotein MP65 [Neolecta irregularis DAH-3]|uniref:Cell surface mannoprotein MP65 n=1 Tax=Neolecta irregularis (strain DAH-3) TaxID=1198029 RepID=A0A1U7LIF0_NEOID|nr:Cell surface mannoprotein MP65 [Neolecta irregularis DAH-3]|eukprot:OLL22419.1 Cell surface mannoprotein MP65 [Neolecta irregularis DAH-3]